MNRLDCDEAMAHLYDYLKREITADLAAEVRRHLEHCRDCFHHARFEENFLIMLETRATRTCCPGEVRSRIVAALRAEAGDS
jgi:anti-sigma factor (TIGR02949 family)